MRVDSVLELEGILDREVLRVEEDFRYRALHVNTTAYLPTYLPAATLSLFVPFSPLSSRILSFFFYLSDPPPSTSQPRTNKQLTPPLLIQNLTTTHPLFGIILVALFLIQPIFGLIHHIQYKRNLSRAGVSHLHIWYGRILMLLAIINGGLGLQLANNSRNGKIAYAVVAAVVGVVYIAMCVFKRKGSGSAGGRGLRSGRTRGLRKEESAGSANGEGHALPAYAGTPPEGHYGGRTVFK